MLNQKALDYIFDVNTKIDAKLSRLNQKIDAKLSRHFRDMERVYAVSARRCSEAPPMGGREIGARDRMSTCSHAVRPGGRLGTGWRRSAPATRSPSLHSQVSKSPARASASALPERLMSLWQQGILILAFAQLTSRESLREA